ncbi:MAG: FHA domain-containing protein [Candidatus Lernaella stagnicola]|nr:FHA domain-containing protein [Candidatus Lernaella stagnicola]
MLQLKSTDGDGQILVFPLNKPRITAGRDPSNDVVLTDEDVSRWHAVFSVGDRKLSVRDMNSTNGLFVNNVRIHEETSLAVGDIVILGSNLFAVSEDEWAAADQDHTIAISAEDVADEMDAGPETAEPIGGAGSFDKTVARSKFDLLEGAFEKKVQVARFSRLEAVIENVGERRYLLAMPVFRIGRAASNHLRIADPQHSGSHAEIRMGAGQNVLVDLGSANGTKVNDQPITEHILRDNDVIDVPGARLTYRHRAGVRGRFSDFWKNLFGK